jgi:hypothetical protein
MTACWRGVCDGYAVMVAAARADNEQRVKPRTRLAWDQIGDVTATPEAGDGIEAGQAYDPSTVF